MSLAGVRLGAVSIRAKEFLQITGQIPNRPAQSHVGRAFALPSPGPQRRNLQTQPSCRHTLSEWDLCGVSNHGGCLLVARQHAKILLYAVL
jgi:hypothetical protein